MPPVSGSSPRATRWPASARADRAAREAEHAVSIIATSSTAPSPGPRALGERGQDADHAPQPAAHVGELEARHLRRRRPPALDAEDARAREVVEVVPGALRERAGLAVAGERADDEPRVRCAQLRVREAEAIEHAGPELLEAARRTRRPGA